LFTISIRITQVQTIIKALIVKFRYTGFRDSPLLFLFPSFPFRLITTSLFTIVPRIPQVHTITKAFHIGHSSGRRRRRKNKNQEAPKN
jgi:hypothetical protein